MLNLSHELLAYTVPFVLGKVRATVRVPYPYPYPYPYP